MAVCAFELGCWCRCTVLLKGTQDAAARCPWLCALGCRCHCGMPPKCCCRVSMGAWVAVPLVHRRVRFGAWSLGGGCRCRVLLPDVYGSGAWVEGGCWCRCRVGCCCWPQRNFSYLGSMLAFFVLPIMSRRRLHSCASCVACGRLGVEVLMGGTYEQAPKAERPKALAIKLGFRLKRPPEHGSVTLCFKVW